MKIRPAQRPASLRFRFFRSFSALILREMTTSYGRSPGGYIWAILEPIAGLTLLSLVFAFILRAPPLGTNFFYFFAGGLLPYTLYATTNTNTSTAVRYSRALLEYPAVSFIDALLARFFLNAMTQLLVMFILISGIIFFSGISPVLRWPAIFEAVGMALALGFGVGTINCYLFTLYPLWERVWAILNRPMFILSGVMYIPESMPWQWRDIMMLNPLLHVTSQMRKGMFSTYEAKHVSLTYVFLVSCGLCAIGLLLLLRHHKSMAEK